MAGTNQLTDLLRALHKRRWQVAVPTLLVGTIGSALAVIWPKRFELITRIEISDMRVEQDFILKNPQETGARREAPSANEHVKNYVRIKEIVERNPRLWPEYVNASSTLEREQFLNNLKDKDLWAVSNDKARSGTIFVDVHYMDVDKDRGVKFLDELTKAWLDDVYDQGRENIHKEREELRLLVDEKQRALQKVEDSYYEQCKALGVDPLDVLGGDTRLKLDTEDWTFKTQASTRTALAQTETQLSTAETELQLAEDRFRAEPDTEELLEPVAGVDRADMIREAENKLEELRKDFARFRPGYSQYDRKKAEIDELEGKIQALLEDERPEASKARSAPNPRKKEYQLAVRDKEDLVARLKSDRDYLQESLAALEEEGRQRNVRMRELETLRNDREQAQVIFNEKRRELSNKEQALRMYDASPKPWRVAQPPVPATTAPQPNGLLIAFASFVGGFALGMGLAVLSEFARSSYRTVADLASVMTVPVLGAVETIVTRREKRRRQASRAVAGLSTAVIVGSIGWITWMWYSAPERLPLEVQQAIEGLQKALR